jgi:ABC-type proline/glycine betaine transport system ATPase subunit
MDEQALKVGDRVLCVETEAGVRPKFTVTRGAVVELRTFPGDDYVSAIWKPCDETDELRADDVTRFQRSGNQFDYQFVICYVETGVGAD